MNIPLKWQAKGWKTAAIWRITVRQQLAYKTDFIVRASFLLLILFIFVQLWSAAYDGDHTRVIAGLTLKQIVWYLVFTEAITMAAPPLAMRIEEEVKSGDIAMRLIRPLSYVGYHFVTYLSESYFRFLIHLVVGGTIAWIFVGVPSFGYGWLGLFLLSFGALTIGFLLNASIALCAFWIEETRGLDFVLQKLQFTVGGMLIPLELMPEWLQHICALLPFQAVLYFPAHTAVDYEHASICALLLIQFVWIALLGTVVISIYRKGVAKLHVNGG